MLEAAFLALVIAAHDGDTLTVAVPKGKRTIRLAYIDAPELAQPWGRAARDALRTQCLGVRAWVQPITKDRYGRTVAQVQCRKAVDASERMVERGMAWVFTRYTPAGSSIYARQARAQHFKRGLWSDTAVTAPWQYRAAKRAG